MGRFFQKNLTASGRRARGVIGAIVLMAGIICADWTLWVCIPLVLAGLFAIFEAVRGWCILRACGIRTKV